MESGGVSLTGTWRQPTDSATGLPPQSVAVVLGTRPEMIKLRELIRLLGPAVRLVHTGQHYDRTLSGAFFAELELPAPTVGFAVGGHRRGRQIGEALGSLDDHFAAHPPAAVVVQGDTNAVVAGALAANAAGIPLVHIEAGLRSFDRAMPEEHNRVVADHLSDLCCTPTETTAANLRREGVPPARVVRTGNTVVEAVRHYLPDPRERAALLASHGLCREGFVLSTFHRPENVDDPEQLSVILGQLGALPVPIVLPLHPRTAARIRANGLESLAARLRIIEPVPYRQFLGLAAEAALLVSDSGGVQEEVSVLKRPVIVVRNSTERPEALGTFATLVPDRRRVAEEARHWLDDPAGRHAELQAIPSPYGDGSASIRSVRAMLALLGREDAAAALVDSTA